MQSQRDRKVSHSGGGTVQHNSMRNNHMCEEVEKDNSVLCGDTQFLHFKPQFYT